MKNKYRSKFKKELKIINYITTTEIYRLVFLLTILLGLYGGFVLGSPKGDFVNSLLTPLSFPIVNVLLFSIIFLNNINTCSILKKNFPDYILRLGNKKKYVRTIVIITTLMYLYHFTIIMLFILMPLLITTLSSFKIETFQFYGISNLTYLLFYVIRYAIYGLLITIISSLIYINTNTKVTLIINSLFLLLMYYFGGMVSFRTGFSILIWSYFTTTVYSSFSIDVASSVFMLLILEIIVLMVSHLSYKNRRLEIL